MPVPTLVETTQLRRQVIRLRAVVRKIGLPDANVADRILTNAGLLFETIASIYADPQKYEYLPRAVTSRMVERVNHLNATICAIDDDKWDSQSADQINNMIDSLDATYADALMYGLVTFGFEGKVAEEHFSRVRAFINKIESDHSTVNSMIEDFRIQIATKGKEVFESSDAKIGEIRAQLEKAASGVMELANAASAALDRIQKGSAEGAEQVANIKTMAESAKPIVADLDLAVKKVEADTKAYKSTVDSMLALLQPIQAQAQNASSEAKAAAKDSADARARVTSQLNDITNFYADIEKYKGEMLETRKRIQQDLDTFKDGADSQVKQFGERTQSIVSKNEELQKQINDHLHKAVGASLFLAFDNRRKQVQQGTMIWGVILMVATVGAAGYALWFAYELKSMLEKDMHWTLLAARSLFAVPVTFLIGFCAKQYSKERRSEEEYAFKSAISVSLESYRDLLIRMKQDGHTVEVEFVKELLAEIFDNPVKRMYGVGQPTAIKSELTSDDDSDPLAVVERGVAIIERLKNAVTPSK